MARKSGFKIALLLLLIASTVAVVLWRPWESRVWFRDVTTQVGVDFEHSSGLTGRHRYLEIVGGGVAVFDYDGDGWLDLYFVNGNHLGKPPSAEITNVLYRNDGDGTFTDVTRAAGVGDSAYGQGCCAADYDHDGDVDLFVSNYGPDRLYRNNGDGTFTDVATAAGVACDLFGQSVGFFDADGDGWLDLYVQNYLTKSADLDGSDLRASRQEYSSPLAFKGSPDRLYRNQGDGTFKDVTRESGLFRPEGRGMGLACVDFDGDHDLDIFIANDGMENYYFLNDGKGKFEERSVNSGLAYNIQGASESSMGVDVGDFDEDGRLDIACPALRAESCTIYKNRGSSFDDVSRAIGIAGVTRDFTGFSPSFLDIENDGDLDLFLCNGGVNRNRGIGPDKTYLERYGVQDQLLINDGKGGFRLAGPEAGPHFAGADIGRGSATGDFDNDGDLDLVVCNLGAAPVILRNEAPRQGGWVTLDLRLKPKGAQHARAAIGAVVKLEAGGRQQTKVVRASGGYLSLSDRRLHFGLGATAKIDRIEVTWPDGRSQQLESPAPNRIHKVVQAQ